MNLMPSHPGKTPHRVLVRLDPEPRAVQNRWPPVPDDRRLGDDILGPMRSLPTSSGTVPKI